MSHHRCLLVVMVLTLSAGSVQAVAPVPRRAAKPQPDAVNLAGDWLMSLPAGFEHQIKLIHVGPNRYRLEPRKLNSSGIYEVRKNRLVIVTPNDPRLLGFEWEIQKNNHLVLVGQPPVSKTGSSYLKATLTRPK